MIWIAAETKPHSGRWRSRNCQREAMPAETFPGSVSKERQKLVETGPRPVVLVPCDYYLPGYKAGGPIRTVSALVERLSDEFQFAVVTRDRDLDESAPLSGIEPNVWK